MNKENDERPVLACVFVPGVLQVGTDEELEVANRTVDLWNCPETKGAPSHPPHSHPSPAVKEGAPVG